MLVVACVLRTFVKRISFANVGGNAKNDSNVMRNVVSFLARVLNVVCHGRHTIYAANETKSAARSLVFEKYDRSNNKEHPHAMLARGFKRLILISYKAISARYLVLYEKLSKLLIRSTITRNHGISSFPIFTVYICCLYYK